MIDPNNITNYNRTLYELEEFALFSVFAAGKNSDTQALALNRFLRDARVLDLTPFKYIQWLSKRSTEVWDMVEHTLRESRIGQYKRLRRTLRELSRVDMQNVCVGRLERVYGIGPKTARLIVMHSQEGVRVAALDVHILSHMRDEGFIHAPISTPPAGPVYRHWERVFIAMADVAGMSVADYDLMVWKEQREKKISGNVLTPV